MSWSQSCVGQRLGLSKLESLTKLAREMRSTQLPTTRKDDRMAVFDDVERWDGSPASHSESHAEFLNRVHTPYWAAVRGLIEDWAVHLPAAEQVDIGSRLRSPDNRQFHGAFWELYLHECLIRLRFGTDFSTGLPLSTLTTSRAGWKPVVSRVLKPSSGARVIGS